MSTVAVNQLCVVLGKRTMEELEIIPGSKFHGEGGGKQQVLGKHVSLAPTVYSLWKG